MATRERRTRGAFDQDLKHLETALVRMGVMAGALVRRAVDSLEQRDVPAAAAVIADDAQVDAMHLDIERRVVTLIATQQPMAGDLRMLASMLTISIDLERLADHAEGIADAVRRLARTARAGRDPWRSPVAAIPYMEQLVAGMLHDVMEAFTHRDPVLAEAVAAKDQVVDNMRAQVFRAALTYMAENPRTLSQALDLILIAQHLERAADHVTNIAERVVYAVTGELKILNPEDVEA
jgi:phosphate transport system protein